VSVTRPEPATRRAPDFGLDAPDDAAFAARIPQIAAYLRANFPGLQGLGQHRPHFDPARDRTTDPIEHTLEVLAALDTTGLAESDVRLLRAATIFHDVGKLLDPFNVRHAIDSAVICAPYLADFPLPPADRDAAIAIVLHHDVLGRVCQGRITVDEALDLFGTPHLADLTARLSRADVGSIRGLARVLPSIEAADRAVQALFVARRYSQRYTPPGELTAEVRAILDHLTPHVKLWLTLGDDDDLALSGWRVALLDAVAATGSLARAAERLDIPYRTARYKLREIERHLGLALVSGQSGGAAGGTSELTPAARELIARWRAFSTGLDAVTTARFAATFRPPRDTDDDPT
jgi:molybdate transport system regulatory protein